MRRTMPRTAKFNIGGIVAILAAVAFAFGALLDLPIAEHSPHYPAHEVAQLRTAPLQGLFVAASASHCQDNAGCHAAVLPGALPISGTGLAGAAPLPARELAASDHLSDLSRPPPRA